MQLVKKRLGSPNRVDPAWDLGSGSGVTVWVEWAPGSRFQL